jgi:sulfur carrier protein
MRRRVSVNGAVLDSAAATLHELLLERGYDAARGAIACAVNGSFVARARWPEHAIAEADCIDIVAPVVGG